MATVAFIFSTVEDKNAYLSSHCLEGAAASGQIQGPSNACLCATNTYSSIYNVRT